LAARYRLLALDLDGTTLNSHGRASRKTRYWIRKALEAGVVVVCATGRGRPKAQDLWDSVFSGSPAIFANGGEIWLDPATLLERRYMETDCVRRVYELAAEVGGAFWGYNDEGLVHGHELNLDQLEGGWYKCVVFHPDPTTTEAVRELVAAWAGVSVTSSHPRIAEIGARGVSKRAAVERLCREFSISMEDVMAVGDSQNDIDLLQAAGLGVAMGNALPEVKAAADRVTKSNRANGVAWAIRKFLL
jgi:HAD superfamily hydrolase (TIGR01484 family)